MNFNADDSRYMARAIQLARRGWFTTRTNPRVGCLLVKDNIVIGQGWHEKAGLPHAEINAIFDAHQQNHEVEGATAYVTLEPCSHHGKTPPCAEALVQAGVRKVICSMLDPNPKVSGRGVSILEKANIEVQSGLMESEARALNSGFIKRMTTGLPRVVAKTAVSLDGRTAMASGESQWITGPEARKQVQTLRAEAGAILTGSGTVLSDNPAMNVRDSRYLQNQHFVQPLRVVIDSGQRVNPTAKILNLDGDCWLVNSRRSTNDFPGNVRQKHVNTVKDRIDLKALLTELGKEGINDVLVEAGGELLGGFLSSGLVDELVVFMAPKLMGSDARAMAELPLVKMSEAMNLELRDVRQVGQDLKLTYRVD
ncbi:bifunctional diaminohydroxyphosphoribosylaminopyrimidine deaminase/5-amino-6-(5-phosphoribosylamino)uracil reductase RibD [Kangiella sediminilitoris]|uniref:Riboflavin biosynthesis protein RibD n=1 Tax=Kangiella sediminilitoris TaxID=1144748 RepID=A0A1B3BCZ1_9GAMM|nr:bifunctional diaminohydroxyphosphoribosylaminopyrimidine deaminase/5-amino-6-(5-phosphoribosylamino)uracil reductase RibD [Kangiella sediminilitoris]AOE50660.1 Riboflavin biosynthesis protein RibD [Kangiella sediminilitoris]